MWVHMNLYLVRIISKEEARRFWTLDERMDVTNDEEEFISYVKDNFILASPSNFEDNNIKEEDDGYFSEGEFSFDETNEVDDVYFYCHLNDDDDVHEHKRKYPQEDKINLFCKDDEEERKLPANVAMLPELKTIHDD